MNHLATITSKRQFTIPAAIFKELNLQIGQKVIVSSENNELKIISAQKLVDQLAGSVKIPPKLRGVPFEKELETPISIVSVGPDRKQTWMR